MAEVTLSSLATKESLEDADPLAGRDDSGSPRHARQHITSVDHSTDAASTEEALRDLRIEDKHQGNTAAVAENIDTPHHDPSSKSRLESADSVADAAHFNVAQKQPKQRPWAEPPIVSYKATLSRQIAWQKLFLRLPTITPPQRCRIFDLVGENDALRLYIASLPESEFSDGLLEEVQRDQRDVEEELDAFMDGEGLTTLVEEVRERMGWREWCEIWCAEGHQRDCPAAGGGYGELAGESLGP